MLGCEKWFVDIFNGCIKKSSYKKKKVSFCLEKKKSYEVHSCYGDSPCSVFRRSQWGEGQEAMGVRLAPSRRCPHCHFWAPVVKAQSGKNPTDQTPGTTDISCFYSRVSKPQKLLPLAFLHPSLYCPSILLWLMVWEFSGVPGTDHFLLQGTSSVDKAVFQKVALLSPLLAWPLASGFSGKPQDSTSFSLPTCQQF